MGHGCAPYLLRTSQLKSESPARVPVPQNHQNRRQECRCHKNRKSSSRQQAATPSGGFFIWSENMTRQEVRAAILALAEKLKQAPTIPELMKHAGIDRPEIRKH